MVPCPFSRNRLFPEKSMEKIDWQIFDIVYGCVFLDEIYYLYTHFASRSSSSSSSLFINNLKCKYFYNDNWYYEIWFFYFIWTLLYSKYNLVYHLNTIHQKPPQNQKSHPFGLKRLVLNSTEIIHWNYIITVPIGNECRSEPKLFLKNMKWIFSSKIVYIV